MKIKRIIIGVLLTVYLLVAIFLTACLLNYNDYKISVFGDKSFIIVKNDEFEPSYKKGALLIVKKNKNDDIKVNDEIFFYNTYANQIAVSYSKVIKTEKITDTQTTYTITGNYELSSDYVIGKAETTKVMNDVGSILGLLESRWGFLIMIVLPISVLFLYEIYVVVKEITRPDDEEKEKETKEQPAGDGDKPIENNNLDTESVASEEPVVEEKPEANNEVEQPVVSEEEKKVETDDQKEVEENKSEEPEKHEETNTIENESIE